MGFRLWNFLENLGLTVNGYIENWFQNVFVKEK